MDRCICMLPNVFKSKIFLNCIIIFKQICTTYKLKIGLWYNMHPSNRASFPLFHCVLETILSIYLLLQGGPNIFLE